jgi:hypothetical protein
MFAPYVFLQAPSLRLGRRLLVILVVSERALSPLLTINQLWIPNHCYNNVNAWFPIDCGAELKIL